MAAPEGFEWDPQKAAANFEKHGVRFEDAIGIFERPRAESWDRRKNYGEDRIRAIGECKGIIYYLVYTRRGGAIRVISARRASPRERANFHARVPP